MENNKKFIENHKVDGISVLTDTGWEKISSVHKTIEYKIWIIKTKEYTLKCADNHILFLADMTEIFVKNLNIGDEILTDIGCSEIISIEYTDESENMYDIQVNSNNHRYFTDGFLSHNTTVTLDIMCDLNELGYDCCYVSAEMTRIDMYKYVQRFPKFGKIDILFLGEYTDNDPKQIMEDTLRKGYDVVLIDSFVEVQSSVSESSKMTMKSTEKWLVDLLIYNNLGNNNTGKNTMFMAIQQVTKEGVFLGSNKLKHNTTGMLELRFENIDDPNNDAAYLFFSKNRRGKVGSRLYFSLQNGEDVEYSVQKIVKELIETQGDLEKLSKGITVELNPNTETNPFEVK